MNPNSSKVFESLYLFVFIALFGFSTVSANGLDTADIGEIDEAKYGKFAVNLLKKKDTEQLYSVISSSMGESIEVPYAGVTKPKIKLFTAGKKLFVLASMFLEIGIGDPYGWVLWLYEWPNSSPLVKMFSSGSPLLEDLDQDGIMELVVEHNESTIPFCLICSGWPYVYSFEDGFMKQKELSYYPQLADSYKQKTKRDLERFTESCQDEVSCQFQPIIWYLEEKLLSHPLWER